MTPTWQRGAAEPPVTLRGSLRAHPSAVVLGAIVAVALAVIIVAVVRLHDDALRLEQRICLQEKTDRAVDAQLAQAIRAAHGGPLVVVPPSDGRC